MNPTPKPAPTIPSSLKDNRTHCGTVGQFLENKILPDSVLSFVSAYFTVHAYEALSANLENARHLRFLFGEPSFIAGINKGDEKKANFKLTEAGITTAKTLTQQPRPSRHHQTGRAGVMTNDENLKP